MSEQKFSFDRYMDDIVLREERAKQRKQHEDTPRRARDRQRREKPHALIRFNRGNR